MEYTNIKEGQIQEPRAELNNLADHLELVKEKIRKQRERQGQIEERIVELVGVKEEGTITQNTKKWKISTTGGLVRSLESHDPEAYRAQLGDRFDDLVSIKLSIRTADFRRASQEEQAVLMEHMVIKPRKTAVKVEPKEEF